MLSIRRGDPADRPEGEASTRPYGMSPFFRMHDTSISQGTAENGTWTFVSKFASDGTFQWVRAWGPCSGSGMDVDNSGNVFVTGGFYEAVDFNPDPVEENWLYPEGEVDAFVLRMDNGGDYHWAENWGTACGYDIAGDESGSLYVTGLFEEKVDFNPGDGIEEHTSNGDYDVFLSKLDDSGDFQWARTWGSDNEGREDLGKGVAVDIAGNIYVTGQFWESADFDPGPGEETLIAATLEYDVFVSKFDSSGGFVWARNWGGISPYVGPVQNIGYDVAVDAIGDVYVTGEVMGTCDFDPGPGVDEQECDPYDAPFLSKFTSTGTYLWARNWGHGWGFGVASDAGGNIHMCGFACGLGGDDVDMDAGEGEDIWPGGAFVLRMLPDGSY